MIIAKDPRFKLVNDESIYVRYASMNVMKKPFDDVRVRLALNYAVDKNAFRKVVYNGAAGPLDSPLPRKMTFYVSQGAEYPYDPAKAKQLLAEAGHPDGFETVMWSNTSTTLSWPRRC